MSDAELVTSPSPAEPIADPIGAIRTLAEDTLASIADLRSTQIPQHVGMAAACRQLAVELPRMLAAQIEADLRTGVLAKRWEQIHAAAAENSPGEGGESTLAAISVLLREQTRAVMRHLAQRGKDWTADAYRLEGQAAGLEGVAERLQLVAGPAARAEVQTTAGEASESAAAAA